jgi:hypothetical protein
MKISDSVRKATVDWEQGEPEASMLHACNAIDGTARKLYPKLGNKERFTRVLRENYGILGPMGAPGRGCRPPTMAARSMQRNSGRRTMGVLATSVMGRKMPDRPGGPPHAERGALFAGHPSHPAASGIAVRRTLLRFGAAVQRVRH